MNVRMNLLTSRLQIHGHDTPKGRGLSPHAHTGRVLAHHHTSYPALGFLVLLSLVLGGAYSMATRAESSSSQVSLTVLGPPPSTGATIDQPVNGQRFTTSTTTVRGTCPAGLLVEIYRNGSFAGSTMCDNSGLYNLIVTLVPDQNDLVARVADALGQYGPDSATVTVYYDVPPEPAATPQPSPGPTAGAPTPKVKPGPAGGATPEAPAVAPLLIDVKRHYYLGLQPGEELRWAATVTGGTPPYRAIWDWADSTKDAVNATAAGDITTGHTYDTPGIRRLVVRASDAAGREAVLTLVAIVNGPPAIGTSPSREAGTVIALPALLATGLAVASFWLGERHKVALLRVQLRETLAQSGQKGLPAR